MSAALLDENAQAEIRRRVAELERATGIEAVAAIIARADAYPEVPWKAFALGASVAALVAAGFASAEPDWGGAAAVVNALVTAFAAGCALGLGTVWSEPLARAFLPRARRRAEVVQHAQAMFLESGLHRTRRGDGVLLLASLFEHEVAVIADRAVLDGVGEAGLGPVAAAMTDPLARGQRKDALLAGLARLQEALAARGFRPAPGEANEIPDTVVAQRGPS